MIETDLNLPNVKMDRIIFHWTAGTHTASSLDKSHYHFLIEGDGKIVRGVPIEKNAAPPKKGYAAHTLNCNSGSIGVALCGMAGAQQSPFKPGKYPIKLLQVGVLVHLLARLCEHFDIKPDDKHVLSHAEVQSNLGIRQRGKWDISIIPGTDLTTARAVGTDIRAAVKSEIGDWKDVPPKITPPPVDMYRVTNVAPDTLTARDGPNGDKVGSIPSGTVVQKLSASRRWWQVKTPQGFIVWVWSDYLEPVT